MSLDMAKEDLGKAPDVTGDPRWNAVANRDASFDGAFVYAVTTTRIYCRPACPSRLAKPEHVRFFARAAEAEEAGFRACQRCRPDQAPRDEQHAALVAKACRMIEDAEEAPALQTLAQASGMSPSHFHRLFKSITGLTPKAYASAHRSKRIREGLSDGEVSVTQTIYAAGFNSSGRFYETSNQVLGMTPSVFRSGGSDTSIKFATGQSSLGVVLVACSAKGVCAIFLGDDPNALLSDLRKRFPKADLAGGDAEFEALVSQVVAYVEAPAIGLNLPLDVQGTAFQQRVWQALREIPVGSIATYQEIVQKVGRSKTAQEVAEACGANPLAVIIPCHRVIRSDGSLAGYRWGLKRKRALLEREQEAVPEPGSLFHAGHSQRFISL